MHVGIDVTYMYTDFGGRDLSGFGDTGTLKNGQISLSDPWTIGPWSSKNLINWNRLKKIMHVRIDVTYMYTDFGGRDLSGFGDTGTLKNGQIFPFGPWTIVHGHQKI